MTSSESILKDAMVEIGDDTKLIRLATITTFVHSLLFIIYIVYVLFTINQKYRNSSWIWELLWDYIDIIAPNTQILIILIILWIALLIGYTILPPIGESAMIFYLDDENKRGSSSLWKWITRFFPMFEFNATMTFLNILAVAITLSRLYVMDILNWLTITLMVLWTIFSLIAMFLLPYTKFIITLQDTKYFDAMKKSATLAISNISITFKFIIINFVLYLRFIINVIIVIWIPLLLLWVASRFEIADQYRFQILIIVMALILVVLTAYINGIIEAFFITYWYKVYKKITT